ncbi:MAG: hypothetical protein WCT54_01045 [Patescibacteria group bacterium]|jgi:hypothetical protein
MIWALSVSLAVLGLAYLIRSMHTAFEVRNTFFLIIGAFLILYIGAVIFVTYNIKAWGAEKLINPANSTGDSSYTYDEPLKPVDMTTYP